MHKKHLKLYQHKHNFHEVKESNFKKVMIVIIITFITMVAEIVLGWLFGSMALLSDGWHMATHVSALSITLATFYLAKKYKNDKGFAFSTWKMEILGAYTSAIFLFLVGVMVIFTSLERMLNPVSILYNQALIVAMIGLFVNIVCAFILGPENHAHDEHEHIHEKLICDPKPEHDLNMKSAYLHVLADALTSIFAIIALFLAKYFSLVILDPFIGILSSILIFRWSFKLLGETSSILLDKHNNAELIDEITKIVEKDNDSKIADLHLWKVGQNKYSCILTIVAIKPKTLKQYKENLKPVHELAHLAIEIVTCA